MAGIAFAFPKENGMALKSRTTTLAIFAALAGTLAAHSVAPVDAVAAESTGPRMTVRQCGGLMKSYFISLEHGFTHQSYASQEPNEYERVVRLQNAMNSYNNAAGYFMDAWSGGCSWTLELEADAAGSD